MLWTGRGLKGAWQISRVGGAQVKVAATDRPVGIKLDVKKTTLINLTFGI